MGRGAGAVGTRKSSTPVPRPIPPLPDAPRSMPPLPASWGEVASLEDMPCVLWVYVPQRK